MNRDTLDSLDKEMLIRLILSQAEAIERLTKEVEALRAENAALRAKLNLPPKTPKNSSTPPSEGNKASGEASETSGEKRCYCSDSFIGIPRWQWRGLFWHGDIWRGLTWRWRSI